MRTLDHQSLMAYVHSHIHLQYEVLISSGKQEETYILHHGKLWLLFESFFGVSPISFLAMIISYCINTSKYWLRAIFKENDFEWNILPLLPLNPPMVKPFRLTYLAKGEGGGGRGSCQPPPLEILTIACLTFRLLLTDRPQN